MKQKFALIVLIITLLQQAGFGQNKTITMPASFPLIAEDEITSITASENIDLVLIQDRPENVGAKAAADVMRKLKVSMVDGNLILATAKSLAMNERLIVYVWVNDLENLTLNGNAFATCRGILNGKNLHVSAATDASFSIKSRSKVWFDTPAKYEMVNKDGYFFVSRL
jgi:hypothetical protein